MARYNIKGGYLELELVDDKIKAISDKLKEIASTPVKEAEIIKIPKDIQKIGERQGEPKHFLVEK